MFIKETIDVGESVGFMVRCFTIEQPFEDTFAEQIFFLHF